jgi:cytochrome c biogenesis factor
MTLRDRWAREHALLAAWILLVLAAAGLLAALVVPTLPREVRQQRVEVQVTCPNRPD